MRPSARTHQQQSQSATTATMATAEAEETPITETRAAHNTQFDHLWLGELASTTLWCLNVERTHVAPTQQLRLTHDLHLKLDLGSVVMKRRRAGVQASVPLCDLRLEDQREPLHVHKRAVAPETHITGR